MKLRFVTGSASLVYLAIAGAPAAWAQAQAAAPATQGQAEDSLADIVVTAQRRTEKLQDVPVSATALDGAALANKSVVTLSDLQTATPALSITDGGIVQNINIRGVGLASSSPSVTAGVATYIDGLFQPPIVQANSFYDLASVEVLRGPQGTLVGSNSTGGAIFINSRNPDLNKGLGGYLQANAGNYGTFGSEGALNLPVSDTLGFRVAGFTRRHDSYYTDVGPFGSKAGKLDEKGGRLTAMWKPGSLSAIAKIQINDRNTGGYPYRPIPGTQYGAFRVGDIRTLSFDTPTRGRELAFISSLELRQELANGIVLRSLSGYQYKRVKYLTDLDASRAPSGISEDYFAGERQYSEEINIISPTNGRFKWILGGYFQRNVINVAITDVQDGFPTDIRPKNQRTTAGVFAQGNYQLTPALDVQVGGRYSTYKATGTGSVFIGRGIPGFPTDGTPVAALGGSHKDSRFTGKVALNWKLGDNLLYGLVARGYKPGGFNSTTSEFNPETVMSYEIGWKSTLLDRHIRTQVSAFYNSYKGFQFDIVEPSTGFSGVQNISTVTLKGFEAQIQGKFGGFVFDGNLSYVDSKLSSVNFFNIRKLPAGPLLPQCGPGQTPANATCFDYSVALQSSGNGPNLYAPKWTYNLGVSYEFKVGAATLTPRINYAFVGSQFTYLAYSPVTDKIAARRLVSAQISYARNNWHIDAYGTNLTDKRYVSGQFGTNEFYGAPREYGIRAGIEF